MLVKKACACIHIGMLYNKQSDLLYTQNFRQQIAENCIMAVISNSTLDPTNGAYDSNQWRTDGSMIPAAASLFNHKSITAAVTGNKTVCLKLSSQNISILHDELIGLITGLIILHDSLINVLIHTDYLNSVRLIDNSCTTTNLESKLWHMNAWLYYCWLLVIFRGCSTVIKCTKRHANNNTLSSILSTVADQHMVNAQSNRNTLYALILTFFIDDYTLYNSTNGWIESNTRYYNWMQACTKYCTRIGA